MRPSAKSRAKARRVSAERKDIRWSLLAARGAQCEGCPVTPVGDRQEPRLWSDMHEILTRGRGGDPTDPANILCLCRECHVWVTTHELEARALGLVRARTAEEHAAQFRVMTWCGRFRCCREKDHPGECEDDATLLDDPVRVAQLMAPRESAPKGGIV